MEEKYQRKLQLLMQNEGISQSRLAEMLEVKSSTLSHILAGRNYPGFEILQKLRRLFPHINADWLLLDTSENYRSDTPSTSAASVPSSDGNIPYGAPAVPAQGTGVVGNGARPSGGVPGGTAPTAPGRGAGSAGTAAGNIGPREMVGMREPFGSGVRGQAAAPSLFDAPSASNVSPVGTEGVPSSVVASQMFPPVDRADGVRVRRVIVLYDDGSFESFTPRP